MDELRAAIDGKTFHSLNEANAFAQGISRRAKTGFRNWISWGFPSEQMHLLLDFPFARTRDIVEIDLDLAPAAFRGIPVVDNALLFLGRLAEQEPLKATAKGNIPCLSPGRSWRS